MGSTRVPLLTMILEVTDTDFARRTFTVAAFVQANFGSRAELIIAGRPVGAQLLNDNPLDGDWFARDLAGAPPDRHHGQSLLR